MEKKQMFQTTNQSTSYGYIYINNIDIIYIYYHIYMFQWYIRQLYNLSKIGVKKKPLAPVGRPVARQTLGQGAIPMDSSRPQKWWFNQKQRGFSMDFLLLLISQISENHPTSSSFRTEFNGLTRKKHDKSDKWASEIRLSPVDKW